jgi:hypothetical protein
MYCETKLVYGNDKPISVYIYEYFNLFLAKMSKFERGQLIRCFAGSGWTNHYIYITRCYELRTNLGILSKHGRQAHG